MSGGYPMTEHRHEPELTVASLRKDLAALRTDGLRPAIEKERVPLLLWLARRVAAQHDPAGLTRLTTGNVYERRQAAVEHIKALIESVPLDLPGRGNEAIATLFALDAQSIQTTPEYDERHDEAAAKAGYTRSYLDRRIARDWLDQLAERMYEHYSEYALVNQPDRVSPSVSTPPQRPQTDAAEADVANDQPSDNEGASPGNEPTDHRDTEQTDQPVAPKLDAAPAPSVSRSSRRPFRSRLAVGILGLATIIGVLIAAIVTSSGGSAIVGGCGATTAQLFNPTTSETPEISSAIYMYAPHQEGGQHGWADYFLGYPESHNEAFHVGEVRLLALSYSNTSSSTDRNLIARVALPKGATLIPGSTCLYLNNNYASGIRYTGTPLLAPTGLKIGSLAANVSVYVTSQMRLPTTQSASLANTYGGIGSEDVIGESDWTQHVSYIRF
jgi:hypothetical protein